MLRIENYSKGMKEEEFIRRCKKWKRQVWLIRCWIEEVWIMENGKGTTGSQCLHEFRLHVIAFDFATYCNEWSTKMSEKYGMCWIEDMPNIEYINISRKIKKDSHGIITKIEKAWEPGPYECPNDGDWTLELTFGDGSTEQLGWCSESVYVSSIDEDDKLINIITGTGMGFFDRLNGKSEVSR